MLNVKPIYLMAKVEVVPVLFINGAPRREGIAPLILDLGTRIEVSGQLHAPAALPPGKEPVVLTG
jgi:hypothetical protein